MGFQGYPGLSQQVLFAEIKADLKFCVHQVIDFFSLCAVLRIDGWRIVVLLGPHAKSGKGQH
jgi:hypothetical protein